MTLSLVSAGNDGICPLTQADLSRLQANQFEHDETNHREIARLPVQKRITHMTLHFSKYVGRLFEGDDDQRTLVDVFVIALSSANVLGVHLQPIEANALVRGDHCRNEFVSTVARAAGLMAAACEKLDHLEEYPYRSALSEAVKSISEAAQFYAISKGWDLSKMVGTRLAGVRTKVFDPSKP